MKGPRLAPDLAVRTPLRQPVVRDVRTTIVQVATAVGAGLMLFGLFSLVLEEISDLVPLLVIMTLGVAGLRWLITKVVAQDDLRLAVGAMTAGLLLRAGLAMVIHFNLPDWFFAPDQVTYQDVGWRTLQYLRGLGPMPWQITNTTEVGHFYWNAIVFYVFGNAPLAVKLANAVVGTASALLAYRLAGELAGPAPARNALLLTMFFPSLVLWSALDLRDPIVLLLTLALFLSVAQLRVRPTTTSFFATLLALGSLILFRDYIAVMVVFGLVGSSLISTGRGLPLNIFLGAVLFGLAVFVYQRFGLGSQWVESMSFESIALTRSNLAIGRTAFDPGADVSTPLQGLAFLPRGLAFFFFSPFPWQLGSALSIMTLPEQVVWYGLMPAVWLGGLYLVRKRYHVFGPVLVFVVMTSSVYALVEGNAGTAYRHRAQVLIFFLIMAGVGLELMRLKREASPKAGGRRSGGNGARATRRR